MAVKRWRRFFELRLIRCGEDLRTSKATPSAQLTLDEFHKKDSALEFDPPVYIVVVLEEHGASGVDVDLGRDSGEAEEGDGNSRDLRIGNASERE